MTVVAKKIPTPAEINAQQRRDAEAAQKQQAQAKPGTAVTPAAKSATQTAVAPDNRTSVQQYLDEVCPASIVGRRIKFSKDGQSVTADDDEVVSDDVDFVALCDQTLVGRIKFNGEGKPPDYRMGLLYDGFIMPPRAALGDLNEAEWQIGLDGRPQEPWGHWMCLVLQNTDTAELFTFTTNTTTGRRAVGNLLRHYDRMRKTHPDTYPVVRLKTGGFNHRDERVGWVPVPVFAVVGRTSKDGAAAPSAPPTPPASRINDEIPL
jgi:hypothetical protein